MTEQTQTEMQDTDVMDLIGGKKVEQKQIDFEPTPEPVEAVEPVEPVEAVEPTEPTAQVEPTKPVEPTSGEPPAVEPVQVSVTESDEYKKLKADHDKLKTERDEYESLLEDSDPLKYFANENEYKKQQILKNNPDIAPGILDALFGVDVKNISPADAVIYDIMARTGENDLSKIREHVYSEYNYDPESGDIPFKLKLEASEAKKRLSEIVGQDIPAPKDIKSFLDSRRQEAEAKVEQTKATFRPMAEKFADEMKDISEGMGKDAPRYEYDLEFKKQIPDLVTGFLVSEGAVLDNAEQKFSEAKRMIREVYILNNFDKIVRAHVDEAVSAKDNEWRAKMHNPSPPNTQTAPVTESKDTTSEDAVGMIKGKK